MTAVVLASASPRRIDLLSRMGLCAEVIPCPLDECPSDGLLPSELVMRHASDKAAYVSELRPDALVIGADTAVCLNNDIFGKPKNRDEAYAMLKRLSGREHSVFTGVCVCLPGGVRRVFHCETKVRFRSLSDGEILNYINTGEPMDKAGAYAIQGMGGAFAESIEGEFNNVVGLPTAALTKLLWEIAPEVFERRSKA